MKLKVICLEKSEDVNGFTFRFSPVVDGSPENKEFFRFTPSGEIKLYTINKSVAVNFTPGKEYFVEFTPSFKD